MNITDEFGMNLFPLAYLVFSFFFLILFMDLITLFGNIHGCHCTIQLTFNSLFFTLSAKKFQFQLNKLFPNRPNISPTLSLTNIVL